MNIPNKKKMYKQRAKWHCRDKMHADDPSRLHRHCRNSKINFYFSIACYLEDIGAVALAFPQTFRRCRRGVVFPAFPNAKDQVRFSLVLMGAHYCCVLSSTSGYQAHPKAFLEHSYDA